MAACNYCGTTILFGGKKEGGLRFCNDKCLEKGRVLIIADQLPQEYVDQYAQELYRGACPKCGKNNGPIDVRTSYQVWSALILTSWSSKPQISCRSCGIKSQATGLLSSLFLGWWGIPWGIFVTPVQIVRNFVAIVYSPDKGAPSKKLEQAAKLNLAQSVIVQQQDQDTP